MKEKLKEQLVQANARAEGLQAYKDDYDQLTEDAGKTPGFG